MDESDGHQLGAEPTNPALRLIPALIRFLRYSPFPVGETLADELVACRTAPGLSQAAFAQLHGIDPGTLSRVGASLRLPTGRLVAVNS